MTADEIRNYWKVTEFDGEFDQQRMMIFAEIAAQLAEFNSFARWFADKFTSNGCIDVQSH